MQRSSSTPSFDESVDEFDRSSLAKPADRPLQRIAVAFDGMFFYAAMISWLIGKTIPVEIVWDATSRRFMG